jgi:hypothetical protein
LRSFPKSNFDEESWLPMLQRGLHDILFSKISKKQRDPAMQLVAAVIEVSGTGRSQGKINKYTRHLLLHGVYF